MAGCGRVSRRAEMILRAPLTPLVVGMFTASLITAVVLQHHENVVADLAAEPLPVEQTIPEPPITTAPAPSVAPLPAPPPPPVALPKPTLPVAPKPLKAGNAP